MSALCWHRRHWVSWPERSNRSSWRDWSNRHRCNRSGWCRRRDWRDRRWCDRSNRLPREHWSNRTSGPTGANGSLCVGPPVFLSFDETGPPNPIANADNTEHPLAAADGGSGLPTSYTYHGLQLTPLGGTSEIFAFDLTTSGPVGSSPGIFIANDTLLFRVDTDDPAPSLKITSAAGSYQVFSLFTLGLAATDCGSCDFLGVQIIGTLAGNPVDACNVGTIVFTDFF